MFHHVLSRHLSPRRQCILTKSFDYLWQKTNQKLLSNFRIVNARENIFHTVQLTPGLGALAPIGGLHCFPAPEAPGTTRMAGLVSGESFNHEGSILYTG